MPKTIPGLVKAAISGVNITTTPPTSGNAAVEGGSTTSDFSRSAGAWKFTIKNVGPAISGGQVADVQVTVGASVNTIKPGESLTLQGFIDEVNNVQKFLPAITVTTNGAGVWWEEIR